LALAAGTDPAGARAADPEVQAINAVVAAAEPQLTMQAQAVGAKFDKLTGGLFGSKAYRRKVRKARAALESMDNGLGALRGQLGAMQPSGARGQLTQRTVIEMIDLLLASSAKLGESLTGKPRQRRRDAKAAYKAFGDAVQKSVDAGFLLQS
jgi:hypothetical protein